MGDRREGDRRGAIVTGGARNIGRAVALALARQGVAVCVADLDGRAAAGVAREARGLGCDAVGIECDVASETGVGAMFRQAIGELGGIRYLVNNAGVLDRVSVVDMPLDRWERMLAVHLRGTFLCSREAVRHMSPAGGGAIVNVASGLALKGLPGGAHYAAAKAGILAFTKSLAAEVGPLGIRVNAVAPGPVETELLRAGLDDAAYEQALGAWRTACPLGRIGTAEDLTGPVLFLLGEEARFVTGQTLHVNGGGYMP